MTGRAIMSTTTFPRVPRLFRSLVLALWAAGVTAPSIAQEYRGDDTTVVNFIRRINDYPLPSRAIQPQEQKELLRLLDEGRFLISTTTNIRTFRLNDNQSTINKLIKISEVDDRSIRISASLILANVVDNTTMCVVLDRLLQPSDINDDLRFNLLQIIRVASRNTTYVENAKWIAATIEFIRKQIRERPQGDYEKTLATLQSIEANLAAMNEEIKDRKLGNSYPGIDKECLDLPNIKRISQ
jgi:hypothetical protein